MCLCNWLQPRTWTTPINEDPIAGELNSGLPQRELEMIQATDLTEAEKQTLIGWRRNEQLWLAYEAGFIEHDEYKSRFQSDFNPEAVESLGLAELDFEWSWASITARIAA